MKKFDFRKVPIQMTFEGEPQIVDISKLVGNLINGRTSDFAISDLARKIYYDGEVEIPDNMLAECKKIITNCDFVIPVKKALIDAFTEK